MGGMTKTNIINQGMTLAGKNNTQLLTTVTVSFDAWLRSTYKGWLWPYLSKQSAGVALAQGATSLLIGTTSLGALTDSIDDLFDPVYMYTSGYTYVGSAKIRQIRGGPPEREPGIINPVTNTGIPVEFKARPGTNSLMGQWTLTPYPFPDRDLILKFDYKENPDVTAASPRYENDRTMIQAAKVFTLEYMNNDAVYQSELKILADMVMQDFAKDAARTGSNDNLGLDDNTFKR